MFRKTNGFFVWYTIGITALLLIGLCIGIYAVARLEAPLVVLLSYILDATRIIISVLQKGHIDK